jgi:16S rRNA (cytosine1402-N4)-methyltransferase
VTAETGAPGHEPVLLREALEGLSLREDGWYVDATYGRGGHSAEMLARLGSRGRVLALDKDPDAVAHGRERFRDEPRFTIRHAGFENLEAVASEWLDGERLLGILFDLGVSSPQLASASRGFSFAHDGPLDMRMDNASGMTAAQWLAKASQTELADAFFRYGEEPQARRIAAAIVRARSQAPLTRTRELAELVASRARGGAGRIHPATRVFQAVRIVVNDELAALQSALAASVELLAAGGRLAVISFHSLEDRIVKRFMAREARGDEVWAGMPNAPAAARPRLTLVGKLVRPSTEEIERNPRARSARLRIAERVPLGEAA